MKLRIAIILSAAIALLVLFIPTAKVEAQNPQPCASVQNSATKGQVLSAQTAGRTPVCKWVTGGGGGGSGTVTSITATGPIVVTPSPLTTTGVISCPTCSTSSFNPLDMTKFYNVGNLTIANSINVGPGFSAVQQDGSSGCITDVPGANAEGTILGVNTDTTIGHYCSAIWSARDGVGNSPWTDFVSAGNFKGFTVEARYALVSTSSDQAYVGVFSSLTAAIPTDGVYLEFDPAVSANWQCTVRSGGSSTRTTVGVAPAAGVFQSLVVSASAAGTLSCTVGGTTVTVSATFPAANFIGFRVATTTTANKDEQIADPRYERDK